MPTETVPYKKPSVILSEALIENPNIQLACNTYYDPVRNCYCALGLIAHARGADVSEFESIVRVTPEFYRTVFSSPKLSAHRIASRNDEGFRTPIKTLESIIVLLEENGL